MIPKAPCKGCSDRKIGCHSMCERYLAFAEYRKRINETRLKNNEIIYYYSWRKINNGKEHK